jgi:hypothetical protein
MSGMSKSSSSNLTTSPETSPPPPKPKLDLDAVLDCAYGHYPWDDWERYARACGLGSHLAGQARLLIREAFNHDWPDWLKPVCGWSDDGRALLAFALRSPKAALRQWDILFRTDGLRGDFRPRTLDWVYGYLRADALRLLARLSGPGRVPARQGALWSILGTRNSPLRYGPSHS